MDYLYCRPAITDWMRYIRNGGIEFFSSRRPFHMSHNVYSLSSGRQYLPNYYMRELSDWNRVPFATPEFNAHYVNSLKPDFYDHDLIH